MTMTPYREFEEAATATPGIRWVPVVDEVRADMETAVSLLDRWSGERSFFLLESVEGGEKWGRYSFIGLEPSVVFRSKGRKVEVREGRRRKTCDASDPLAELKKVFAGASPRYADLPRLAGGAVGYIGYDMVRFFERLPGTPRDDLKIPDLYFVFPEIVLVLDNLRQTLQIVCNVRLVHPSLSAASLRRAYARASRKIQAVQKKIARLRKRSPVLKKKGAAPGVAWESTLSRDQFCRGVEKIKEYILAGDVTQTVLSIRFSRKSSIDPFDLYRTLRQVNPSPYMFFMKFEGHSLVGASPETMVHLEGGELTLRPIAGTRHRGKEATEDRALEKELLADAKERAEHIMLVDLGRNDLGRIAQAGSVRVDELMGIERYSHVMHIVSNVRGRLAAGKDAFDVLRATFPAGTLTGSPKIRAMEIVDELEPVRRGTYGGSVGYFSFSGNMDMAITIRSALICGGKISLQVGAGIVADSQPAAEYQECLNKARGMMEAIKLATRGGE